MAFTLIEKAKMTAKEEKRAKAIAEKILAKIGVKVASK